MEQQPDLSGIDIDRTIFRVPKNKDHPYLMVAKATVRDRRLSLAARGLLQLMLAEPDDWDFSIRHLAEEAGCGRTVVSELLRDLIDAGYVRRERQARRGGRFGRIRYLVYELPTVSGGADTVVDVSVCPTDTVNTVSAKTTRGESYHTDTSSETEDREERGVPAPEPLREEAEQMPAPAGPGDAVSHLPEHMRLAVQWYKRVAKETGRLISPSGEDLVAALDAVARTDAATVASAIEPYFTQEFWFTRDKRTRKPAYSFRSFLAHFPEVLASVPPRGTGPPQRERKCPACGQDLTFGSGIFSICRCGKAWLVDDGGGLEEVRKGVVTA